MNKRIFRFLTVLLLSLSFKQWRISSSSSSHGDIVVVVVVASTTTTTATVDDDHDVDVAVAETTAPSVTPTCSFHTFHNKNVLRGGGGGGGEPASPPSITTTSLQSKHDQQDDSTTTADILSHHQNMTTKPTTTTYSDDDATVSNNNNNTVDDDDDDKDKPHPTTISNTTNNEATAGGKVPSGQWEIINLVDQEALERCLQRRDLEEVFGLDMAVICTCITANTVTRKEDPVVAAAAAGAEDQQEEEEEGKIRSFLQGRKNISNSILSSSSTSSATSAKMTVQIVVQLTCTDSRSRFNSDGIAGKFSYCIPKDDICGQDHDIEQECCGNRICDYQRGTCVALPSSTSTRYNGQYYKLGGNQNGSVRHHQNESNGEISPVEESNKNNPLVRRRQENQP
jgi:hypothetical protein